MIENFISKFPNGFIPRLQQVKLINDIENAYKAGYKYVIAAAPTGAGKSFISKTLGNVSRECSPKFRGLIESYDAYRQNFGDYSGADECLNEKPFGTFALTITKNLQDQYKKDFIDSAVLKGKTNYQCKIDENYDVENAPCVSNPKLKESCWGKNICPYYNARNEALTHQFGVLNYKMFLSLPGHLKRKEFIICDEASELEDEFVNQFSVFIDPDKLKKYGISVPLLYSDQTEKVFQWLTSSIVAINDTIGDLLETLKQKKLTIGEQAKLTMCRNLLGSLTLINETWTDCEYICDRDGKTVRLLPLRVNALTKYVFNYGEKVLLMSAIIIDHVHFAKTLGIENYKYIEVDSCFDAQKAPIKISTKQKLNKANLQSLLPTISKQVQQICEIHKNVKGIIHTHTHSITKSLENYLRGDRFIYRNVEANNEDILKQHSETSLPTVLVSPSMTFGVDLKDDLARFQIIIKAAYLPLGDKP